MVRYLTNNCACACRCACLHLCTGLCVHECCVAPCQNFATSLLNLSCLPIGSISIGSIYAALAISALVAPVVIRKFGERMAMIVTSMAYWSYVLSVSYIVTPVVLLTSINIGLCGGVSSTCLDFLCMYNLNGESNCTSLQRLAVDCSR